MIRSVFDYGCVVYGAAALDQFDVVQTKALRVCIGAFNSTSIPAMLVEVGEAPLHLRRMKLALNYIAKLKGSGENIMSSSVLNNSWELAEGINRVNRSGYLYFNRAV